MQGKLFGLVAALFGTIFLLSTMGTEVDHKTGERVDNGHSFGDNFASLFGLEAKDIAGQRMPVTPDENKKADFYGWNVWYPAMIREDDSVAFVTDVIADYPKRARGVHPRPASYAIVDHDETCIPRPKAAGETLANISIGGGGGGSQRGMYSDLHVFSATQFAKDGRSWLNQSLRKGALDDLDKLAPPHPMAIVDVILTDTSGPLYVVLQNRFANGVLWNLVPAPGVTIAHVAMIGPKVAVNAPEGDFDIQWLQTGLADCVPPVARAPKPFWDMYHRPMGNSLEEYETKANEAYMLYDAWFYAQFGERAEDRLAGLNSGNHILWGPMPEAPIPYRPVEGSHVVVAQADFIFTAPTEERVKFLADLQFETLQAAAGGDLALVFPEPISREAGQ